VALVKKCEENQAIDIIEDQFLVIFWAMTKPKNVTVPWSTMPPAIQAGLRGQSHHYTTGGAGQLYRYTTNPSVATADGLAAAFRAGCRLADMEFIQFHPTVLYSHDNQRFLIPKP
jgi:L-aspartate oxidase